MNKVEIKDDNGVIKTKRTASVGKTGFNRWAIFGEFFNPITFEVDRFKLYDLKYPHYRTRRAAEASLDQLRKRLDDGLLDGYVPWYTTNREGVENRAKHFGIEVRWVA